MSNILDLQLFPSDDELFSCPETPSVLHVSPEPTDPNQETPPERSGRKIQRSYKPRSRRLLSPPASRSPAVTSPRPSLHPTAAILPIPPISKWSVNSLRQALSNFISPADLLKPNSTIYSLTLTTAPASQQTPQLQTRRLSPHPFLFLLQFGVPNISSAPIQKPQLSQGGGKSQPHTLPRPPAFPSG